MLNQLADDELLNVPLGNLTPGELARAFTAEAKHARKIEEIDQEHWVKVSAAQQDQEHQREKEEDDFHTRQTQLLFEIRERENALFIEQQEQDSRTIRLADGRRAFADGQTFRDEDGHELHGADRAQAEQEHLEHPDATTWQEHENLQRRWAETERLKAKVEKLDSGGNDAELTSYEKDLRTARDSTLAKQPGLPDYGTGDYATELAGLSDTFKVKATGAPSAGAPVLADILPKPNIPIPR